VLYERPSVCLMNPVPAVATTLESDWRVMKIRRVLSAHHGRTDLACLARLSGDVGLTPAHLSRVFKSITGVNFREYCITARIHWASALLLQTPLSVKEVAAALGYKHASDFVHAFKRRTGSSPGAFRRIRRAQLVHE
jgi:AraC-like DNA-binding protein